MKRFLPILLTIALLFTLSVPAFAEKQYVTSLFFGEEKDEAYWDKMFERDKEQDWEANGVPKYTAPGLDVPDPTPEQIARWKEQAQKRLEEEKENDRVDMSLDSEKNTRMMNLVFGDKLNDHSDVPESSFRAAIRNSPARTARLRVSMKTAASTRSIPTAAGRAWTVRATTTPRTRTAIGRSNF